MWKANRVWSLGNRARCSRLRLFFVACGSSFRPEWNLPVKLGATKSEVYGVLGKPSYQATQDIEWFQNSGLAINYDPVGMCRTSRKSHDRSVCLRRTEKIHQKSHLPSR